jgi:hypothetical protein
MSVDFFKQLSQSRKISKESEASKRMCRPVSDSIRYIKFTPSNVKHALIRKGIPITCAPNEIRETLTEEHLFHFQVQEMFRDRTNPDTPVYIGVFLVNDQFVHPLDGDLKQIYKARQEITNVWKIMNDKTPYWIDIYAIRMMRKKN